MGLRNPDVAPVRPRPGLARHLAWPRASPRPLRAALAWGGLVGRRSPLVAAAVVVPPLTDWEVHASLHPARPFAPLHGLGRPHGSDPGRRSPSSWSRCWRVWRARALAARLPWRTLLLATYAGSAGVDARARVRGRPARADPRDREPQRVPPHRPRRCTTCPPCCAASSTGSRSARTRQLADPRRRPPARGAAVLRRPGPARARRRVRRRARAHADRRARTAGRRAGDAAAPRRRGRAPGAPRRSWCWRPAAIWVAVSADARVRRGRAPGGWPPWPRPPRRRPRARLGLGSSLAGLLLGCCLLLSYGLPLLAPARPRGAGWPRRSWRPLPAVAARARSLPVLGVRRLRLPAGGRPTRSCTTATGRASRAGARRRTGSGATSPRWLICAGPGARRRARLAGGRRPARRRASCACLVGAAAPGDRRRRRCPG